MTTGEMVGIGANVAAMLFNLVMVFTRHRRLIAQRDEWRVRFFKAMPFVMMISRGPFKDLVPDEIRDEGEALVTEQFRRVGVHEAMCDVSRDGTIN